MSLTTREKLQRYLHDRLNEFSSRKRLLLLYYIIWVHGQKPISSSNIIRTNYPFLKNQLQVKDLKALFDSRPKLLEREEKTLNKLFQKKNTIRMNSKTTKDLNEGLVILDNYINELQRSKALFEQKTKRIDLFSESHYLIDFENELREYYEGMFPDEKKKRESNFKNHKLCVILLPLSLYRKLETDYYLCEKQFVILRENRTKKINVGYFSETLIEELLFLISARFNILHNGLIECAKIQFLLLLLFYTIICLPSNFPSQIFQSTSFFVFTVYLCFIKTQISQNLKTVCNEINAVTGRLGVSLKKKKKLQILTLAITLGVF
jgi:uncharacterized protein YoxC